MIKIVAKDCKHLDLLIKQEMEKNGPNCDLNHIDVSNITSMSYMFLNRSFDGDISEWDVSNVTNTEYMFWRGKFNGDISKWNFGKVTYRYCMFNSMSY